VKIKGLQAERIACNPSLFVLNITPVSQKIIYFHGGFPAAFLVVKGDKD
jgi:hypothetical protein